MADNTSRENPYVGFRPFFAADALYFFGRAEQTRALLDLLRETRYVPVLGSSGSGKSSLVLAGLIPTLQGGFMVAERDRWVVVITRPGDAPLENFARALHKALGTPLDEAGQLAFAERLRAEGEAAVLTLLEERLGPHDNLLVLADQFEEIFTFRAAAGSEEDDAPGTVISESRAAERVRRRGDSQAFVSLLVSLSRQQRVPAYTMSTMRTDFLGDCDRFAGLPELINRAGYLVPRLSRKQLRETIEGPARLKQVRVAPRLADFVLNYIGDRSDMLPILQHAMHRTWETWLADGGTGPLDQTHLQKAGGLQRALALEADSLVAPFDADMVGRVFKRLTRSDLQERRVRRPTRRSDLFAVAAAPATDVQRLLDVLSADGTNFLFSSADGIPEDPRYDISHESLIRQWDRLRGWIDEERGLVKWYADLCAKAVRLRDRNEFEELSLLRSREQKRLFAKHAVSAVWASRYTEEMHATWDDVQEYLRRNRRRRWRLRVTYGAAALLLLVAASYANASLEREAARSFRLRMLAAIERLIDIDPTYAKRLAGEFTSDIVDGERLDPAVLGALDRLEHLPLAAAEFSGVTAFAPLGNGDRVVLGVREGFAVVVGSNGRGTPAARLDFPGDSADRIFAPTATSVFIALGSGRTLHWHLGDATPAAHVIATDDLLQEAQPLADSARIALLGWSGQLVVMEERGGERARPVLDRVLAFDPHPRDRDRIAVARYDEDTHRSTIGVVDVRTGAFVPRWVDTVGSVTSVHFAARDSSLLVVDGAGSLYRIDGVTGRLRRFTGSGRTLSIDRTMVEGEFVVAQDDGLVAIVDDDSLIVRRSVSRHGDVAMAMAVPRTVHVLSGTQDGDVRFTSSLDSTTAVTLQGRVGGGDLEGLQAAENFLFRFESGGTLRTWSTSAVMMHNNPPTLVDYYVQSAMLAPAGLELVTIDPDGRPDRSQLPQDSAYTGRERFTTVVAVSEKAAFSLLCADGVQCRIWTPGDSTLVPIRLGAADTVRYARFSPDGRLLAMEVGHQDLRVITNRGDSVATVLLDIEQFQFENVDARALWAFSADSRYLAARVQNGIQIVEAIPVGSTSVTLPDSGTPSFVWAPRDAQLAVASGRRVTVHRWDGNGARKQTSWTPRPAGDVSVRALDSSGTMAVLQVGTRGLRVVALDTSDLLPRSLLLETPRTALLDVSIHGAEHDVVATAETGETYLWQWRVGSPETSHARAPIGARFTTWLMRTTGAQAESPVMNDEYIVTRRLFRHYSGIPRRPPPAVVQTLVSDSGRQLTSLVHAPWQRPRLASWTLSGAARIDKLFEGLDVCLDESAVATALAEFAVQRTQDNTDCAMTRLDKAPRTPITTIRVDTVPLGGELPESKVAPRGRRGSGATPLLKKEGGDL